MSEQQAKPRVGCPETLEVCDRQCDLPSGYLGRAYCSRWKERIQQEAIAEQQVNRHPDEPR